MNYRVPRRRQNKGYEKIFEETTGENFPKVRKEIATQVQEAQRVPYRINPRKNMTRHVLIKLTKIKHKEEMLKAARKKQQITYKRITLRLTADLSTEILQARRKWQDILIMKGKKPTIKINLSSKDLIQIQRRNQKLYRKAKIKKIQHH